MPLRGDSDSVALGQEWELGGYFNKLLRPLGSKVWSANIHLKPASDWSSPPPKTALLILHLNMVPSKFHCLNLPIVPFKCRGGGWGGCREQPLEQPIRRKHCALSSSWETHSSCSPGPVSLRACPHIRASNHVCTFPFACMSGNSSPMLELITDFQAPDPKLVTLTSLTRLNLFFLSSFPFFLLSYLLLSTFTEVLKWCT